MQWVKHYRNQHISLLDKINGVIDKKNDKQDRIP